MTNDLGPLDTAIEILHRGLWPVPIRPGSKSPLGAAWGVEKPTEGSLRKTYERWPRAGVGLRLGPEGGIIDIEVDGSEGEDSYARLMGGKLPDTMGWDSARGPHRVFRYDARLVRYGRSIIKVPGLPGLEIRIGGGGKQLQSCCPPTVGDDGQPRRWHGCDTIAELPEAAYRLLDELLLARRQPERPAPQPRGSAVETSDRADDGLGSYAAAALVEECQVVATATEGTRNDALNRAAHAVGTLVGAGVLDESTAFLNLQSAARKCGLPEVEARRTIRSGLTAGKREPRDLSGLTAVRPAVGNKPRFSRNHVPGEEQDDLPIVLPEWPAPPSDSAYSGLAGEIVMTIAPHSEADPVALLMQLLIAFGSAVGHSPHVAIGGARHHAHEFVVLVGETSAGRKGTSWSDARQFVALADPDWYNARILGGLSSGEGLIYHVRDPIEGKEPLKEKGKIVGYQDVILDHGVLDKRLLIVETEFGGVLKVLSRDGNKLSAVIRQAYDGDTLASLTKGSPYRATDAHISFIGHITADELTRLLTQCDQANGLANRFDWVCVRRSKLLPFGGRADQKEIERLQKRVGEAIALARQVEAVSWTRGAMDLWEVEYPRLTAARPGVFGMVTSRAEAHAVRLALHYAMMDGSGRIRPEHLQAALALWDYCQRSAAYIFGDSLGDRDAQAILAALRGAPTGMSRTEIRRTMFGDNKPAGYVAEKLTILLRLRLVRFETVETGGRPAERWFASGPYVKDVKDVGSPRPEPPPHVNHVASGKETAAPGREDIDVQAVEPDPATAASTEFEEGDI
jgi:hypothetical protein